MPRCATPRLPSSLTHKPPPPFPCHREDVDVVIPPIVDVGAHTATYHGAHGTGSTAFPWSFFTHRERLFVWRGSASRTAWASGVAEANVRQTLLATFGSKATPAGGGNAESGKLGSKGSSKGVERHTLGVADADGSELSDRAAMGWSARLEAMPLLVSARKVEKEVTTTQRGSHPRTSHTLRLLAP